MFNVIINIMKKFILSILMLITTIVVMAQNAEPTVSFLGKTDQEGKREEIVLSDGDEGSTEAPANLICTANVDCPEDYSYKVEWRMYNEADGEEKPFLTRFEDDIKYTLLKDGTAIVKLYVTFTGPNGIQTEYESKEFKITIEASMLNCPDGFSPNGDGINDILKINCQSIVKCDGCIFNRWGQKLHTFTVENIAQGWDGHVNGRPVKDGVYFININAYGSDGIHYKIKKAINVLKGFRESSETDGSDL